MSIWYALLIISSPNSDLVLLLIGFRSVAAFSLFSFQL